MTRPTVETTLGTLQGTTIRDSTGRTVERFLGVPYAAPPIGRLRWSRPEAPSAWTGVRVADIFGPAAPQHASLPSALPVFRAAETNEDCLTLNVWTPALSGARPIMVWIHGGAFMSGGSSQSVYDGARLAAEQDLVVVTINYRLGALGFLSLDDPNGGGDVVANAGLHDQLAALRWVRAHAETFGGDPRSVTVFGESAGGGSILQLLSAASPDRPFNRAIAQSGDPRTLTGHEAARVADAFTAAVGIDRADVARLRDLPPEAILDAQDRVALGLVAQIGMMPFAPAMDGALLDGTVQAGFAAGRAADVDLILGTTSDELRLFPDPASPTLDDERLRRRVTRLVPDRDPAATVAAYRGGLAADATNGDIWEAVRTHAMMRIPNLRLADSRAAAGGAIFVYRFDWSAPTLGAAHAVDIPFTFGTFDREGWGDAVGHDNDAEALGAGLRAAWANFARRGVPDTEGLGPWPVYDLPRRVTMLFDRRSGVVDDPDGWVRTLYR